MFKTIYVAVFFAILGGCVFFPDPLSGTTKSQRRFLDTAKEYPITPPPVATTLEGSRIVYLRRHVLNERVVTKLYQPMLHVKAQKEELYLTNKYILEKPFQIRASFEKFKVPAKEYKLFGMIELERELYYVLEATGNLYLMFDTEGFVQNSVLYDSKGSKKVQVLADKISFYPEDPKIVMTQTKTWKQKEPLMEFEVIYDGIKNGEMSFFYKGAVPGTDGERGSYQTFSFPKDAMTISLAGTLIRVIAADNDKIEFMVLQNP